MILLQSEYFSRLSLNPVISGFSAHNGLDSVGGKSVYVDLHCTINGMDKVKILYLLFTSVYVQCTCMSQLNEYCFPSK